MNPFNDIYVYKLLSGVSQACGNRLVVRSWVRAGRSMHHGPIMAGDERGYWASDDDGDVDEKGWHVVVIVAVVGRMMVQYDVVWWCYKYELQ